MDEFDWFLKIQGRIWVLLQTFSISPWWTLIVVNSVSQKITPINLDVWRNYQWKSIIKITINNNNNNNKSRSNITTKCKTKLQSNQKNNKIKRVEHVEQHQRFVHIVWPNNNLHIEERVSNPLSLSSLQKRYKELQYISFIKLRTNLISTIFLNLFSWPRDSMISLSNVFHNYFPTLESYPKMNQPLTIDFSKIFSFDFPRFTKIAHNDFPLMCFPTHESLSKRHRPFPCFEVTLLAIPSKGWIV